MKTRKYYVVWIGVEPGIYDLWSDCEAMVKDFQGARYKSYPTLEEAQEAFRGDPPRFKPRSSEPTDAPPPPYATAQIKPTYNPDALAVDAACSGNPGVMEYRGVHISSGRQIFHQGPFQQGTNNIGEFLAIVHGIALLKKQQSSLPLYSDSANAILWVRKKKCGTKLKKCEANAPLFDLIARAEAWLSSNFYTTEIIKWDTKRWGEIPADFGRK